MKTIKGFLLGAVVAGAIGFVLGYNHGRGAPLLNNPLERYGLERGTGDAAVETVVHAGRAGIGGLAG